MKSLLPEMPVGKYRVLYDLGIRKKPGLSGVRLSDKIRGGNRVDIKKVRYLKYSIWGECEKGWICMYMNQTFYVAKVPQKRYTEKEYDEGVKSC